MICTPKVFLTFGVHIFVLDNKKAVAIKWFLSLPLGGESRELKELYGIMLKAITPRKVLVGSGNAVRFNPVLQKIISEDFNLPLTVSACSEETAFGAALLAAGGK